jgi:mono/diheme cytochrome c family protein
MYHQFTGDLFMKRFTIVLAALAMMISTAAFAEDGAALYKTKCALCHGAAGEGKVGPAIKGKSDIVAVVTKGGLAKAPHTKAIAGVTEDQAKAIASFLK